MAERECRAPFDESDCAADPFAQFDRWYEEWLACGRPDPTSMVLATADRSGAPSARVVLLKGFDSRRGFTFFTNYDGRKGRELAANPRAALCFHWPDLGRQVRVEGEVKRCSPRASADYFATRPRGSQLAAWASPQSEVLADRADLDARYAQIAGRFGTGKVSRPPFWGGFDLKPTAIEFWQSRESRLHDRIRFVRSGRTWRRERLAP